MSQITNDPSSSDPDIPTSFVTDNGTANPAANIINIIGDNGIITDGSGSTVTVRFARDNTTTSGAATATGLTLPLTTDSVLTMQILVSARVTDDSGQGVGGYGTAVVKNVGGVASVLNTDDITLNGDAVLAAAVYDIQASGANIIVQVTGVAGYEMVWNVTLPGLSQSTT